MPIAKRTFKVRVADRKTGQESTINIEAVSVHDAEDKAQAQGWLVAGAEDPNTVATVPIRTVSPDSVEDLDQLRTEVQTLRTELSRTKTNTRRQSMGVGRTLAFAVLVAIGLVWIYVDIVAVPSIDSVNQRGRRFPTDIAVGASANALENIEHSLERNERNTDAIRYLVLVCTIAIVISTGSRPKQ